MSLVSTNRQYLQEFLNKSDARFEVCAVVDAIARESISLSQRISEGPLFYDPAMAVGRNADQDSQTVLDVDADKRFCDALRLVPVRWYASEERERIERLTESGSLAVAIDPLDGSSNIDVNVSIGTIFSIYEAKDDPAASFLRPGSEQLAAGYVIYGPQTTLLLSLGRGATMFILDAKTDKFLVASENLTIPEAATEFAINASNYRHWPKPVRAYIDDCLAGEKGPRGKNFNMRWVASLVAETHRVLMRGGVFLYPADERTGYEHGRLRMVYECAPIAFLIEQAGGKATNGSDRILDKAPENLHARSPLVFGSADKVDRVAAYHDLPPSEVSPLFGQRGLFSA